MNNGPTKIRRLVSLAALLLPCFARAQAPPAAYAFAQDIAAWQRSPAGNNQLAAAQYARIGRYQTALDAWAQDFNAVRRPLPPFDSLTFAAYRPTEARAYVLARARRERIIILNEAHHVPRHRAFAASLLAGLAAQGYRYFAVEGLMEPDSLLMRRGYPVQASGYYPGEPCFGDLLREALRLEFRVRRYDYGFSAAGNGAAQQQRREQAQARNIQRILAADPQAKILVYCGFAHASERPDPEGTRWLASYLRELTGIDPFTLDQTKLTEAATPALANRYYPRRPGPASAVLLNARQQPFVVDAQWLSVDATIYHPPTTYVQGRPDWLFTGGRRPVPVATRIRGPYPCLVLAYARGEPVATAVPVDVIELDRAADAPVLALQPGAYTVVVRRRAGPSQQFSLAL